MSRRASTQPRTGKLSIHSLVYTPILNLYPPEIFNYSMRANGFAFMQFLLNCCALVLVYVLPIGM